jgi:hypothetical protein
MKSLIAIISLLLISNQTIAQSQWSIQAGIFSIHGPNAASITYETEINGNVYWHISAGVPAFTTGFSKTYSDDGNSRNRYSGTLGKVFGDDWMIHFAWTKEHDLTEHLIWAWGISIPIISADYGTRIIDDYETEETGWEIETIVSTAGSSDAAQFIPLPILNLRYDF